MMPHTHGCSSGCSVWQAIWEVVKREVDLKQQEARLRTFDDAFKRIQGKTGINTIDDMVAEFCDAEDHNFSLINIINGLNKVAFLLVRPAQRFG